VINLFSSNNQTKSKNSTFSSYTICIICRDCRPVVGHMIRPTQLTVQRVNALSLGILETRQGPRGSPSPSGGVLKVARDELLIVRPTLHYHDRGRPDTITACSGRRKDGRRYLDARVRLFISRSRYYQLCVSLPRQWHHRLFR